MTAKTLSDFVAHFQENYVPLNKTDDYKVICDAAKVFFGGSLPNDVVWKIINTLHKGGKRADFVDDL